jgi:hypothetical protein
MKINILILTMGIFSFLSRGQSNNIDYNLNLEEIVTSQNINFKTNNQSVYNELISVFQKSPDFYSTNENEIICQIPTMVWGNYLLNYNFDVIKSKYSSEDLKHYYDNVLIKKYDEWRIVNGVGKRISFEPIDPKVILVYINHLLTIKTDSTNYVWYLNGSEYFTSDNYKGKNCVFSTSHTNPKWDWEYNSDKKDYCKVTERFNSEIIEWIPLNEGKEIIRENSVLTAKKIFIDDKIKETALSIKKMCELAIRYNLQLSKDNDG